MLKTLLSLLPKFPFFIEARELHISEEASRDGENNCTAETSLLATNNAPLNTKHSQAAQSPPTVSTLTTITAIGVMAVENATTTTRLLHGLGKKGCMACSLDRHHGPRGSSSPIMLAQVYQAFQSIPCRLLCNRLPMILPDTFNLFLAHLLSSYPTSLSGTSIKELHLT
jgi:hypothetical protein